VLLSGGLDSATVLALGCAQGKECHALSFRYGQRHAVELAAAARVAASLGAASHRVAAIDVACLAGSALTGGGEVPKGRDEREIGQGIPSTYVPARNTLFVAHAIALAEVTGAAEIALGINALDYSGYPDCRPGYIAAYERMANLATKAGVEGARPLVIHAPLIAMSKADIVRAGTALGVDYSITSSCYDPGPAGEPCGGCDSCALRARGFREAGIADPLLRKFGAA